MAEVEHRSFDSALDAFHNLNADSVSFASLARRKLLQLGTALSTLNPDTRPGGYFRPRRNSVGSLIEELLENGLATPSRKAGKCVKIRDSDDVCFYSDAYAFDINKANAMAVACRNVGLDLRLFEWEYPPQPFNDNDPRMSSTARVIGGGYRQLYRGKLVGFVIGAYDPRNVYRIASN